MVELELTGQLSPADAKKLVTWRAGLSLGGNVGIGPTDGKHWRTCMGGDDQAGYKDFHVNRSLTMLGIVDATLITGSGVDQ